MHTHLYTLNEDYYFIFIQPNKTNEEKIGFFSLHSRTYFFCRSLRSVLTPSAPFYCNFNLLGIKLLYFYVL